MTTTSQLDIWTAFGRALGADPREHRSITGISGIEHQVQAIHVDDAGKRVIVVAAEPNPRIAAMMRVDIQATMPDVHVLVARPVVFDLGAIGRSVLSGVDTTQIDVADIKAAFEMIQAVPEDAQGKVIGNLLEPCLEPLTQAVARLDIPPISHIFAVIQQAAFIDWRSIFEAVKGTGSTTLSLDYIVSIDNLAADRAHGVCPIPIYELREEDWELLSVGNDIPEVQRLLQRLNIYQYFYPAPDQTALAVIDRGIHVPDQVLSHVEKLPLLGHPLGVNELVDPAALPQLLEQLGEAGYVAEGEIGYEISDAGRSVRSVVRYRPREGVISRLLAACKLNVNLNPTDFIK